MGWIVRYTVLGFLMLSAPLMGPAYADDSIVLNEVATTDKAPDKESTEVAGAVTGDKADHSGDAASPSSFWKKVGGWGVAGAVAGSVAPGIGNVIGFFCGLTVGVVHHLASD